MARGIPVPRPGIEPESPALEGGFLTAGPPGKSRPFLFWGLHKVGPKIDGHINQGIGSCVRLPFFA